MEVSDSPCNTGGHEHPIFFKGLWDQIASQNAQNEKNCLFKTLNVQGCVLKSSAVLWGSPSSAMP